jgi:putative two-component system response regulator
MLETLRRGKPPALDIRIADADGRYRWYRARIAPQYGDDGEPLRIIGVLSDIDREKRANQALRDEAERDSLTGLLNRKTAALRVEQIAAAREDGEQCAMLLLDLDGFKQVNDRCGHLCGDELLKNAAEGLRQAAGGSNLASRVGGDEFLLFLRSVPSREAALERAAQVSQSLQEVFARTVQDCQPTCSVGIALCPADGTTFNELFRRSDIALYRAKFAGKGCAMVYDAAMGDEFTPRSLPIAATTRIDSEE